MHKTWKIERNRRIEDIEEDIYREQKTFLSRMDL